MGIASIRILDSAERLLRQNGLESLTTRQVAGDAGLTAMAIYKHFRDKDALVDALVARGFALWEERLAAAISVEDTTRSFEQSLRAYREFALEEPRYFELMFLSVRRGVPDAGEALRRTSSPAFNAVIVKVQQEIDAGRFRVRDASQLILLVWSLAHGLIALHFTGRFGNDAEVFRVTYDSAITSMLALLKT